MKKFIAVLLCAYMVFSLTACKGGQTASNGEVQTITVWTANGHDKAFLDERINEWNMTEGKKNGIRIEYIVQSVDIQNKLDLAFQTDQAPDLFGSGSLSKYVELGYIAAFEDIEGGEKLVEKYKDYLMYDRHLYKDGKCYTLPKAASTFGICYNKDMFKEAGIVDENGEPTPPKTLDELRDYAKRLTNPDKRQYGYMFAGKSNLIYTDDVMKMSSAISGFVDGYNPKTGEYDLSAEATVMKTMLGIKEDGSYYPGVESMDNDQARALFAAGNVGMKITGSYDYGVYTEQFPASIDWGVAPYPTLDEDSRSKQHMGNYGYLMINKKSAEAYGDKVLKVLEFFYGDDLVTEAYKEGIDIPLDFDLVKDIQLSDEMKQWREYAELVNVSIASPSPVAIDMQGESAMLDIYKNDIWTGKIPVSQIDEVCTNYAAKKNEGKKVYQDLHPDYNPSLYIIPDWDSSIK